MRQEPKVITAQVAHQQGAVPQHLNRQVPDKAMNPLESSRNSTRWLYNIALISTQKAEMERDIYNIASTRIRDLHLSLNGSPGPMDRGCWWKSQLRLVREIKAYCYTQDPNTCNQLLVSF